MGQMDKAVNDEDTVRQKGMGSEREGQISPTWNEVKMPQLSLRAGPRQKCPLSPVPFPSPHRNTLLHTEEGSRKRRARARQGR